MAEEQSQQAQKQRQPLRTPRQVESAIEQRIREATEQGAFDNLPTRGKPLGLDLKDAIDHDAWFVNRTMASLGAVPAWMDLGKEIDAADERFRWMASDFARWLAEVRAELLPLLKQERLTRRAAVELRFDDRFVRYKKLAEELRKKIDRFNLEVPVRALERPGLWVAHELRRLTEPYEALTAELGWDGPLPIEEPPHPQASPFGEPAVWGEERGSMRLLSLWRRLTGAS